MYVWIFEKGANFSTITLTLFQANTQAFSFNQPQAVCELTTYVLTHLACVLLATCRRLSLQVMTGQGCPVKKISSFTDKKAYLCDVTHPTPLGIKPRGPAWYQLIARPQGCLPQPSLMETPLALQAPQRPPYRLSPAGRPKSFAPNSRPFS